MIFCKILFSMLMKNKSIINKKPTEKGFNDGSTTAMEDNLYSMYGAKMGQ